MVNRAASYALIPLLAAALLLPACSEDTNGFPGGLPIERVSVDSAGTEGDAVSFASTLSPDGRYAAFESEAINLVAGDGNGVKDVFVHDRSTGETARVSVDSAGNEGNGVSYVAALSADGRYVGFWSPATNLVAGDGNGVEDVFVHDRTTGETTRVSVDSSGNEVNGVSVRAALSADGRYVAFESDATNLVAGDTNARRDIFVHDRSTGETTRVSVDSAGNEVNGSSSFPTLSADGRYVAFWSAATNLVAGDGNTVNDAFVHDRSTGETTRVSVDSFGNEGDGTSTAPTLSADGRYVAFVSAATNLVASDGNGMSDVFVHDLSTGETTRVSVDSSGNEGNGSSVFATLSADGRYVGFGSTSTNLVAGDGNGVFDVFVHDRSTGETARASVDAGGAESDGGSSFHILSADGRYVGFGSIATNLVAGDTNAVMDIFVAPNPLY